MLELHPVHADFLHQLPIGEALRLPANFKAAAIGRRRYGGRRRGSGSGGGHGSGCLLGDGRLLRLLGGRRGRGLGRRQRAGDIQHLTNTDDIGFFKIV